MSLRKKLDKLVKDRPQYEINREATDNQAIARNNAYGRDNAIVNAETQVAQNAADAVAQAKNASSSSAGILAAVAGVNANTNAANAGLAQQEAQTQAAGKQQLIQANAAMLEEKDKAWNQNVNEPYQNKVQELRDRRKTRQELLLKGVDTIAAVAGVATAAKLCWVARAVYGEDDPRWLVFRTWLVTRAPKWFRDLYTEHGEEFSLLVKKYPVIRFVIKPFFDWKVNSMENGLQRI